ncbi:MAG: hypothetical protein ACREJB_17665, partial [Planctomycetaceae bacterium]
MQPSRTRLWPGVIVASALASPLSAAEKVDEPAAGFVRQALKAELDGDAALREQSLLQALQHDPADAAAHWHLGFLQTEDQWTPFEAVVEQMQSQPELIEYRQARATASKAPRDHLDLANWCRRHGLLDQERAHLTAALALSGETDNAELRGRLGFQRVGNAWVTRGEIEQAQRNADGAEDAYAYWRPRLERIRTGLGSPSRDRREDALAELRAIDDPAAIAAMEAVLSTGSRSNAVDLVETLAKMQTHHAADALARQAVLSKWASVRSLAAEKLQSRKPEEYAPELLAALETPIRNQMSLYFNRQGATVWNVYWHENQQVRVADVQS